MKNNSDSENLHDENNREKSFEPKIIHPKHPKKTRNAGKPPFNTVPAD